MNTRRLDKSRPVALGYPISGEVGVVQIHRDKETVKIRKLRVGIDWDASDVERLLGLRLRDSSCWHHDYLIHATCQRMRPLIRALTCARVYWSSAIHSKGWVLIDLASNSNSEGYSEPKTEYLFSLGPTKADCL